MIQLLKIKPKLSGLYRENQNFCVVNNNTFYIIQFISKYLNNFSRSENIHTLAGFEDTRRILSKLVIRGFAEDQWKYHSRSCL